MQTYYPLGLASIRFMYVLSLNSHGTIEPVVKDGKHFTEIE